jgi:hypothetical protein
MPQYSISIFIRRTSAPGGNKSVRRRPQTWLLYDGDKKNSNDRQKNSQMVGDTEIATLTPNCHTVRDQIETRDAEKPMATLAFREEMP